MLKRISPNWVINTDKLLFANITEVNNRCAIHLTFELEDGKTKSDLVHFETLEDARAALNKLLEQTD
ncbi:hypothetical protein C6501_05590 [Candidatus Poribacteria bacterium]|nr:MAG: hypothetical protein C6501_05590 [Candidatus Poribacteria bacterium]